MSVSKPFVFALVCQLIGPNEARDKLRVNSTGSGYRARSEVALHPRRVVGVCRSRAFVERRSLRLGFGNELQEPATCRYVAAVMATSGLYETSGEWLFDIGLAGKSGIGGGIVTIAPGKGALGTFAPPLDSAGNSVKGQLVARLLSDRLGMNLFASRPEVTIMTEPHAEGGFT